MDVLPCEGPHMQYDFTKTLMYLEIPIPTMVTTFEISVLRVTLLVNLWFHHILAKGQINCQEKVTYWITIHRSKLAPQATLFLRSASRNGQPQDTKHAIVNWRIEGKESNRHWERVHNVDVNNYARTLLKMNFSFFAVQLKAGHRVNPCTYLYANQLFWKRTVFIPPKKHTEALLNLGRKSGHGETLCYLR